MLVSKRRLADCGGRSKGRNAALPGKPEKTSRGFWSALQTHLQGVDRATLAVMPEMIRSHAQPSFLARMSLSE